MAKFLFIVNEHPNEAFAISVARETAKRLKAAGHNVVWKKIKFKNTVLGKVWKSHEMKVKGEIFQDAIGKSYERAEKLIKGHKPDFMYDFHACPHGDPFWTSSRKAKGDFAMKLGELFGKPFTVVEVKAYYKKMPKRHLKKGKLEGLAPQFMKYAAHYLRETTSQKLTMQRGLTPEEFGKAISQRIEGHVRAWEEKLALGSERALIPRVASKRKSRARKFVRVRI